MKLSTAFVFLLLIVAGVVVYLLMNPSAAPRPDKESEAGPTTAQFMGKTLHVPEGWGVYAFGTRGGTLSLTRHVAQGLGPLLTLEDERRAPEDPAKFVGGWKKSLRVPGFHPKSLEEYHDDVVNSVGARCVAMEWGGTQRPFRLVCLTSNGRWKLTLSGDDSDVPALDDMARQLPGFVRGL
jgi:hypothetical protein